MDLRAYLVPPFRAEEWFIYSGFPTGAGPFPVFPLKINGNTTVPNGMRGVIKHAKLFVVPTTEIEPRLGSSFTDFGLFNWTLLLNSVAVPGFLNRPAVFGGTVGHASDPAGDPSWRSYTFALDYDILVPVQLRSGDALSLTVSNGTGLEVQFGLFLQGWLFQASCENESASGNAADPWLAV